MIHRLLALLLLASTAFAGVELDVNSFGESLGGWKKNTVEYTLSGSNYRTYKPEITPTPDGGLFVSLRIDHRRGWLASDDHAVLEVTIGSDGSVASAQSNLAIQGRTISSELIRGSAQAGASVSGMEGAVRVGTDLVADLSSKLLREKIVEAGRVSYPAALRHNYNLLYQAIRRHADAPEPESSPEAESPSPGTKPSTEPPPANAAPVPEIKTADPAKPPTKLDIKTYGDPPEKNG